MANCKENEKRAHKTHKTHCIGEKVEIKTILAIDIAVSFLTTVIS